jgi:phosphatidylglycerol---prolipoprotein diacylglyceryl transferase
MAPRLGVAYQPLFFYEQLWDLAVFAILWLLRKRLTTDGQLFALYLGLYAIGKFVLTFLRTETIWFWSLQEAQLFALALAIIWALWERNARLAFRHQQ